MIDDGIEGAFGLVGIETHDVERWPGLEQAVQLSVFRHRPALAMPLMWRLAWRQLLAGCHGLHGSEAAVKQQGDDGDGFAAPPELVELCFGVIRPDGFLDSAVGRLEGGGAEVGERGGVLQLRYPLDRGLSESSVASPVLAMF